jgi:hypothetical protein
MIHCHRVVAITQVTSMFDLRSDAKFALSAPLAIGGWPGVSAPSTPTIAATGIAPPGGVAATVAAAIAASAAADYALERGGGVWTFLAPMYLMDSSSDQSEGGLWTLELNFEKIAATWPQSKRARYLSSFRQPALVTIPFIFMNMGLIAWLISC